MKYIYFFLIVTFLFILYVESSVGNIIWRHGVKGIKQLQPWNIIHYLLNPLHNGFLWNFRLLDVNYILHFRHGSPTTHNSLDS